MRRTLGNGFNTFPLAFLLVAALMCPFCRGGEVIPPSPAKHFNDFANVVPVDAAQKFEQQLEQFERDTSNQVVVAVFPKMQSDSDIADYTFRVKESWGVGQKKKDNGIVLFVLVQDHKMFIQVGYGLEGALPDATCKQIIDQQIAPRFKAGDYAGGLEAGINSILAATRGEYHGNGGHTTTNNTTGGSSPGWFFALIVLIVIISVIRSVFRNAGGTLYQPNRRPSSFWQGVGLSMLGSVLNSRSSGDSYYSGGGGGGGGFSGGGGTGGGGGAGGSW